MPLSFLDLDVAKYFELNINSHDDLVKCLMKEDKGKIKDQRLSIIRNKIGSIPLLCHKNITNYLYYSKRYALNYYKLGFFMCNMYENCVRKTKIIMESSLKKMFYILRDLMEEIYLINEKKYFEYYKSHKHSFLNEPPTNI